MLVTKSVTTETAVLENLETKVAKLVATETHVFGRYAKMRYADWYAWKTPFQTAYLWALHCWRWPNRIDGMSRHTLSRESVFNAMLSLHQKGIAVTRDSLQQVTGEPLGRIREHIDSLIESGRVERLHRGVYRPMIEHDNRPVSVTAMPDGSAKIEVGDNLLMLSPVESGCLGQLLQGFMVAVRRA